MIPPELSQREERLLNAALNPDAAAAVANWEQWQAEIRMEDAPYPELRLLTPVYAHLVRVAPSLKLPTKLRGKARATFAENTMMAYECLALVDELSRYLPVILIKGAGICIRFNAWSLRAMGDVDIQVPTHSLGKACEILAQAGCIPQFGMTWTSLAHRTSLRRNSWNLTRGRLQLDLHWRMIAGPAEKWTTKQMWQGAERAEFLGRAVLLQSPEFALVTSLDHGFKVGTHGDMLQAIVDCASLLPLCQVKLLVPLLRKTALVTQFGHLLTILERLGLSETVAEASVPRRVRTADWRGKLHAAIFAKGHQVYRSQPKREIAVLTRPLRHRLREILAHRARIEGPRLRRIHWALSAQCRRLFRARPKPEVAMLNRPLRYRLWEILWRRASIERLMLRLGGPLSTPLSDSGTARDEYDLRDCAVLDEIAGPGWAWPEPDHTGFWSDRADARLLIPLRRISDHLVVLGVADSRLYSLNARFKVFANGMYLATLDLRERLSLSEYCLMVPQRALFGRWLELSLRPQHYLGHGTYFGRDYQFARSAPLRRLRIYDMSRLSEVFSGQHVPQLLYTLLKADQPQASKFERIKKKIETSQYRNSKDLPTDFNPLVYVLSYPDLFEQEVDPYEHFLQYGRWTGRPWH